MAQIQRFIKAKTAKTVHLQKTIEYSANQDGQFGFTNMHFQDGALITGVIMVVSVMPDADYGYYNDSVEVQGTLSFYNDNPLSYCLKKADGSLVPQDKSIVLPPNVYVPMNLYFGKDESFTISGLANLKALPSDGAFISIDVILNIEE